MRAVDHGRFVPELLGALADMDVRPVTGEVLCEVRDYRAAALQPQRGDGEQRRLLPSVRRTRWRPPPSLLGRRRALTVGAGRRLRATAHSRCMELGMLAAAGRRPLTTGDLVGIDRRIAEARRVPICLDPSPDVFFIANALQCAPPPSPRRRASRAQRPDPPVGSYDRTKYSLYGTPCRLRIPEDGEEEAPDREWGEGHPDGGARMVTFLRRHGAAIDMQRRTPERGGEAPPPAALDVAAMRAAGQFAAQSMAACIEAAPAREGPASDDDWCAPPPCTVAGPSPAWASILANMDDSLRLA